MSAKVLFRLGRATLVASFLLAPAPALHAECSQTSTKLLRAMESELKELGVLNRSVSWEGRIVQIDSQDQIYDYLDLPISNGHERPTTTIGNAANAFYDFSVPIRMTFSRKEATEERLARELLLRPTLLYRITKDPSRLDPRFSKWMGQYYQHATTLAQLLDRIRASTDETEIAALERQSDAELQNWNSDFRKVLTVTLQRHRFLLSYEAADWWESSYQQFIAVTGSGRGASLRPELIPAGTTENGSQTVSYSCDSGNVSLRYQTFFVARTWLDPGGFGYLSWQWSTPSPVAMRTFSASGCDAPSQLGCLVSKIAVLQEIDSNELPRAEFVVLFGTGLPTTPHEEGVEPEIPSGVFRFDYPYRRLVERLRSDTF